MAPAERLADRVGQEHDADRDDTVRQFPEVVTVVSRTGQAEIPTDPMGVETSDIFVILKDHREWTTATTREGLIAKMNEALESAVSRATSSATRSRSSFASRN